jgi:hypothetical protein
VTKAKQNTKLNVTFYNNGAYLVNGVVHTYNEYTIHGITVHNHYNNENADYDVSIFSAVYVIALSCTHTS